MLTEFLNLAILLAAGVLGFAIVRWIARRRLPPAVLSSAYDSRPRPSLTSWLVFGNFGLSDWDFAACRTDSELEGARRFAIQARSRDRVFVVLNLGFLILAFAGPVPAILLLRSLNLGFLRGHEFELLLCAVGIVGLILNLGLRRLRAARLRTELREYLNRSGITVCMKCGFDLRGNSSERCPECGTSAPSPVTSSSTN